MPTMARTRRDERDGALWMLSRRERSVWSLRMGRPWPSQRAAPIQRSRRSGAWLSQLARIGYGKLGTLTMTERGATGAGNMRGLCPERSARETTALLATPARPPNPNIPFEAGQSARSAGCFSKSSRKCERPPR